MPAPWLRLELKAVPAPGMMMAVAAKKHLTIFYRRRKCRSPPGRQDVKLAFKEAAAKTGGMPLRSDRIAVIKKEMLAKRLASGKRYLRSRSKYAPLAGKCYVLDIGETVTSAAARKGLDAVLKAMTTETRTGSAK